MQDEHFRNPEKKTAEDEIPQMAGSPAALAKLTSRYNDDNGHVSAANYKKEQVGAVLKSEYKKGVDVIFESVGGKMFDACTKNVAVGGIVVAIGMMAS